MDNIGTFTQIILECDLCTPVVEGRGRTDSVDASYVVEGGVSVVTPSVVVECGSGFRVDVVVGFGVFVVVSLVTVVFLVDTALVCALVAVIVDVRVDVVVSSLSVTVVVDGVEDRPDVWRVDGMEIGAGVRFVEGVDNGAAVFRDVFVVAFVVTTSGCSDVVTSVRPRPEKSFSNLPYFVHHSKKYRIHP